MRTVERLRYRVKQCITILMPRESKPLNVPLNIRMDEKTQKIIEAWCRRFNEERPGSHTTVSDVVRILITRAGLPPRKRHALL
jgi:hypothetical protein